MSGASEPGRSGAGAAAAEGVLTEPKEDPLLAGLEEALSVLVTGASGFVGRHLLERLASRGHRVRAVCRGGAPRDVPSLPEVTWLAADLRDPDAVSGLAAECDVVAHLAGVHRARDGESFRGIHVEGTRNLLDEAVSSGVERFLLLSAQGVGAHEHEYFRTKMEAEREVRAARVDAVVLRPSLVYGPGDRLLTGLSRWLRALPLVPVPGGRAGAYRPVDVEDLTDALSQAVERSDLLGRTFELVGPDRLTLRELLEVVGGTLGVRRPMWNLPESMGPRTLALARRLEDAVGLPADVWELLWRRRSLPRDSDERAFRTVFHIEPMPFRDAVEDYL